MTKRTKSQQAFQKARQLMPGGVNSPARAYGAVGGEPIFLRQGRGRHVDDIDGNRYIDYVGSWGPLILGHADPRIVAAIEEAARRSTSFGAPTEAESDLAERIIAAVPSVEQVRLVNSGTEATMSAIRLARAATGRERIVKFAGNYHGHVDSLLVAAGSAAATLSVPDSPGVTRTTAADTLILRYNDPQGLEDAFAAHGPEIAAVIFEPVVGNMGVVVPKKPFLATVRRLTYQHGAVLICDEVMTGFRVAYGGAQQRFDIEPDLTTLGKIVGGGLPVGAYGGRTDLMQQVLPAGKVYQAGTLSGNPLATAAGIATLDILRDDPPYEHLERLSAQLERGLDDAASQAGIRHTIGRVGSMMTLFFHGEPVCDWDGAAKCDTPAFGRYFWGMIDRRVMLPCSQYEALFVSAAHTADDIETTVQAAREALDDVAS
ncbi:MAG: glutamate-1-semialdehyde 2,1-aminomutase [Pirellulales bacterium]